MNANDRRLTAFAMLGHASFHTYELVVPVFVTVWLDRFAATTAELGLVVGLAYALTGVGALPSGTLADRYGGRSLVLASMAGMGGGFLVVAIAPSVPVLTVGLLVWGAAASLYHPAGLTLLSRGATERGTAFAYHGVAGNLGTAVGPLVAALMLTMVGWRLVAGALVALVGLAILVALRLEFDEDRGATARNGGAAATPDVDSIGAFLGASRRLFAGGFLLVFLVGISYGLYYRGVFTFLPEVLADLPLFDPVEVGGRTVEPGLYVYSGLLLVGGLGQFVGGKLVERVRAEYALVGTFAALVAVALVFLPAADAGLGPLLVAAAALGFLVFVEAPIAQEVVSRHVPPGVRGLSFGFNYVAILGFGALGAAVAGVVLSAWSAAALFGLLAVFAAVAGGFAVCLLGIAPRGAG